MRRSLQVLDANERAVEAAEDQLAGAHRDGEDARLIKRA